MSVAEFEGHIKSSLNNVYLNLHACFHYVENKHKQVNFCSELRISYNEIIKRVYSYIGIKLICVLPIYC